MGEESWLLQIREKVSQCPSSSFSNYRSAMGNLVRISTWREYIKAMDFGGKKMKGQGHSLKSKRKLWNKHS